MQNKQLTPFPRTLTKTAFAGIATADVVCTAGQFNKVGTYTVSAQQVAYWGSNDMISGQPQGKTAYIKFVTSAPADIPGLVRLVVANATETRSEVVLEERTERFNASVTDRTLAVLLPKSALGAQEDSKLIIYFQPDATATIAYNQATTVINLPITLYQ